MSICKYCGENHHGNYQCPAKLNSLNYHKEGENKGFEKYTYKKLKDLKAGDIFETDYGTKDNIVKVEYVKTEYSSPSYEITMKTLTDKPVTFVGYCFNIEEKVKVFL